jgi:myo-inositol 2-dehydrogenase/D-chiro-inositol 1-dehydrogenase
MTDPIRLGIAGLGAVAQAVHLPILERLSDRFRIAAVADVSPHLLEVIGERFRVPAASRFASLNAMVDGAELEALMILTSGSHGEAILRGLEAGLAVFVEKPLAWTLAEADVIGAHLAAKPAGRLQVGYMKLYDPAVEQAAAAVAERDRVGAIRSIDVRVLHPSPARQLAHAHLLPPPTDIALETLAAFHAEDERLHAIALGPGAGPFGRLYADVVLGSIVHELAVMRALAGDPVAIDGVDAWPPDVWPASVSISGRLGDGARFTIRWHYLPDHPAYREEVRVVTDYAAIELEFPSPWLLNAPTPLRVSTLDGVDRTDVEFRSVREAFERELLAFHSLVVDGTPARAGLAEGRADIVTSQRVIGRLAALTGVPCATEVDALEARPGDGVRA